MSFHAKETIYLSLGSFANHITTHFFNEQDSYLDSANGADSSGTSQPWIDHDVSFRQGYSLASRTETYQPRAILFDVPSEFGSLRRINRLYAGDDGDNDEEQQAGLWPGQVETIRTAGPVGDSSYQIRLDRDERGESADDGDEGQSEGEDEEEQQGGTSSATANMDGSSKLKSRKVAQQVWRNLDREKGYRFWSDYLRVYYHPRSLVSLSGSGAGGTGSAGSGSVYRPMRGSTAADAEEDTQDEANTEASPAIPMEGFDTGYAAAREIERSMDVMDENVRWHAEDSDLLQNFAITFNLSDGFAGFTYSMLSELQDEYSKTPALLWAAAWGESALAHSTIDKEAWSRDRLKRFNTRGMNTAISMALMVDCAPSSRLLTPLFGLQTAGMPQDALPSRYKPSNIYHTSALLSAHLETATLPLRLLRSPGSGGESAADLSLRLNRRNDMPIATLSGCAPTPLLAEVFDERAKSKDPIELLLAAKGYMPKEKPTVGSRWSPEQDAIRAAGSIRSAWVNFSGAKLGKSGTSPAVVPFAQSVVARDSDANAASPTLAAIEQIHHLASGGRAVIDEMAFKASFTSHAYNVPDSFPNFFSGLTDDGRRLPASLRSSSSKSSRPNTLPLISSLSTTPETYYLLRSAKQVVHEAITGHLPLHMYGIGSGTGGASAVAAANEESEGIVGGRDGLKEIRERLEDMVGVYESGLPGDLRSDEEDDGKGTDEEWVADDQDEWDLE